MRLYVHLPSAITNLPRLEDEAKYAEYDGDRGVQVHFPGAIRILHDEDGVIGGRQREGSFDIGKWSHRCAAFNRLRTIYWAAWESVYLQ